MSHLKCEGVTKWFGGVCAVRDVSVEVRQRSVHSLIGPNGAGKTTLFNIFSGIVRPDKGQVLLDGIDVTGVSVHELAALGIGRSFQRTQVFEDLSVWENVAVAAYGVGRESAVGRPHPEHDSWKTALIALDFVGLEGRQHVPSGELSHGEQRALDVAMALSSKPKVLLLDEPTSGMAAADVGAVTDLIARLRDEFGLAILLVEHNVELVLEISDWITVLDSGAKLAEGRPDLVRQDSRVIDAYFGVGNA